MHFIYKYFENIENNIKNHKRFINYIVFFTYKRQGDHLISSVLLETGYKQDACKLIFTQITLQHFSQLWTDIEQLMESSKPEQFSHILKINKIVVAVTRYKLSLSQQLTKSLLEESFINMDFIRKHPWVMILLLLACKYICKLIYFNT